MEGNGLALFPAIIDHPKRLESVLNACHLARC
jgi:hypothetical protein